MKRQLTTLLVLIVLLSGCSAVQDLLNEVTEQEDNTPENVQKEFVTQYPQPPQIYCTYFHYFRTDDYSQWWMPGKDPRKVIGPEPWRRHLWIGDVEDYPYIGAYDNSRDAEVMRWHIRLAKAAGIDAFLLFMNDWEQESSQTTLLLDVAAQEDFKIGILEQHSYLGAAPRTILDGRPQPIVPRTYVGYDQIMQDYEDRFGLSSPSDRDQYEKPVSRRLREVPVEALENAIERISAMLNKWISHPAYLHVDGKPLVVIPYVDLQLTPAEFQTLVSRVETNVGRDLYVVSIVAQVYMYFRPELVSKSKITSGWANTGTDCFTNWTPNGMVTASQSTRLKVMQFNIRDSFKWKKDPMVPIMPGFNDDGWRPGDDPAPVAPRDNGRPWGEQIEAALSVKPRFILIQAWNEWHEGSQIEPSTNYSDPYLYLRILAQKLNIPWQTPPLPPKDSVDPLRLPYLPY